MADKSTKFDTYLRLLIAALAILLIFVMGGGSHLIFSEDSIQGWANWIPIGILALIATAIYGLGCDITGEEKKEKRIRAETPCKHGIIGAAFNPDICEQCQNEITIRELAAQKEREENAAREKAEEQRAYREWVSHIRLPEYLSKMDPEEFEHLVCDLFRRMGYDVEHTPFTGDGGIDGFVRKNGELSILQCKRVKGSVGQPVLRDLFGTMAHEKAKQGIVVTTGKVSRQAREWAEKKPIKIIELDNLAMLIRENYDEHDVVPEGFTPQGLKELCPHCGYPLKEVRWRGGTFLGCSAYPKCRFTRSLW